MVRRNVVDLVEGAEYARVYDVYEVLRKAYRAARAVTGFPRHRPSNLRAQFLDFDINRVDLLHFINVVSFGKTPWVSTFETVLPRYQITLSCHHGRDPGYAALTSDSRIRQALDAMSRPACRNIIAMSDCNARMQRELLRLFPEYRSSIENKLIVLHPPQAAFFRNYDSKRLPAGGPLRFIFVGGSFFRKGGPEMLAAFRRLRQEGLDVALTIISSLAIDDYATKETDADVASARQIIDDNRAWITYFHALPNDKVLDLMKASHVGLLPTYADTYGYSVLEMQACGCPVITTDVRALPEINDEKAGWIIPLPKNRLGEAIYTSKEDRSAIASAIESGLVAIVRDIFRNRADIKLKADTALERIRVEHSPQRHAEKLREIYQGAIANKIWLADAR
jgi:glycosyltransferase involved in cell wall biosynthesis